MLCVNLDIFHKPNVHTDFQLLKKITKCISIDEIDGRCSVARGFPPRIRRKCPSRHDQAFVGPTYHGSAEVTNNASPNRAFQAFTLEQDVEREQVHAKHASAVDATVTRTSGDLNFGEA